MRIKFLVPVPNGHFTIPAGATADVSEPDAKALIEAGKAVKDDEFAMCMQDNTGYVGCLSPQQLQGSATQNDEETGDETPE